MKSFNIGRDFEKRNQHRGRLTIGSGNLKQDQGDLEMKNFWVSLKATSKKQFPLKIFDIEEISRIAEDKSRYWALLLEISGREFVVLDSSWLDYLDDRDDI